MNNKEISLKDFKINRLNVLFYVFIISIQEDIYFQIAQNYYEDNSLKH